MLESKFLIQNMRIVNAYWNVTCVVIVKNIAIIQNRQTAKKIQIKPKTASKTVKTDKFLHPSYQIPNQSDASGAHKGFAGTRDQWRSKIARA